MPNQPQCHLCEQITKQIEALRDEVQNLISLVENRAAGAHNDLSMKVSRRDMHLTKIERYGIENQVVEMFNKGLTYYEIAQAISKNPEHSISHSAVHRFLRKIIPRSNQ